MQAKSTFLSLLLLSFFLSFLIHRRSPCLLFFPSLVLSLSHIDHTPHPLRPQHTDLPFPEVNSNNQPRKYPCRLRLASWPTSIRRKGSSPHSSSTVRTSTLIPGKTRKQKQSSGGDQHWPENNLPSSLWQYWIGWTVSSCVRSFRTQLTAVSTQCDMKLRRA